MSDERPKQPLINVPSNEVNLDDDQQGSWAKERLLDQLQSVNLTAELASMAPSLLPFEHLVRQWMVKRSSCPVEFSWKDLGPMYWPRWIRKGECANRKGLCSYPTGMHCVPGATTKVMLLFWDCEEKKRNRHVRRGVEVKTRVRYRAPVPKLTGSTRGTAIPKTPELSRGKRSPGFDSETSVLYKQRVPHLPPGTHIKKKKRCDWKKVPYPITVDCFCTC